MPLEPYLIAGKFINVAGNAVANAPVFLKNENTGQTISTITDVNGDYLFDCANFVPDYADLDVLTLLSDSDSPDFEYYVSHNGGLSWYQVDNEESYSFDVNSLKVKIDNTNYSGGREIRIIYPI